MNTQKNSKSKYDHKKCDSSEYSSMKLKELRSKAQNIQPTIRIGKNGLTQAQTEEIKCQLKKRKLIKIKILKSFLEETDKNSFHTEITQKTNAKIIQKTGFTITLFKP